MINYSLLFVCVSFCLAVPHYMTVSWPQFSYTKFVLCTIVYKVCTSVQILCTRVVHSNGAHVHCEAAHCPHWLIFRTVPHKVLHITFWWSPSFLSSTSCRMSSTLSARMPFSCLKLLLSGPKVRAKVQWLKV